MKPSASLSTRKKRNDSVRIRLSASFPLLSINGSIISQQQRNSVASYTPLLSNAVHLLVGFGFQVDNRVVRIQQRTQVLPDRLLQRREIRSGQLCKFKVLMPCRDEWSNSQISRRGAPSEQVGTDCVPCVGTALVSER